MDFDRFKQINDTLGHGAGDELLRQVAAAAAAALRPGDAVARVEGEAHVAARIGGDEFVVVLDGVHDAQTVGAIADRLLQDLAEPYLLGSTPVQSSASLGIVLSSGGDATAEEVLRNADTAMYEAKRAGRGRWVMFDDSMHERLVRALALETDLRRALKDGELFVIYQPVVDLGSAGRWAWRPWCAGATRRAGWCRPWSSSASPRRRASSTPSVRTCCTRPAGPSCAGAANSARSRRGTWR